MLRLANIFTPDLAVELMGMLRYLRTDIDPDLPIQQLRHILMQKEKHG